MFERRILSLLHLLIAGLALTPSVQASAQTFTILHSFTASPSNAPFMNSDGGAPVGNLILSGNTLYGTAEIGGTNGDGAVFAVNTDGTGFTNLHSFTGGSGGANPEAGLILSSRGQTLYGTATFGGSFGRGTVFAVNTDGTGFTNLHAFTGIDGALPFAGVILSGNTLYGTTQGVGRGGTVFAVNTDGTGFTNLHTFTGIDGATPLGGLILSGAALYGTTWYGGSWGNGTVFVVHTNSTGFTNLHHFTRLTNTSTNNDGANPQAGLILSGDTLYGTTELGGSSGYGTVFAVNTDGAGFATVHHFTGRDGAAPDVATLLLSDNTLYGTADTGGSSGHGTVFAVNADGTGFTVLHSFSGGNDGATPLAGLILTNHTLYGTTVGGGSGGNGTVFSIFIPPQLTITPLSPAAVTLTWPTNYVGFTLQSTTNLLSPVWITNSPLPVVVNGQNTVTNPISGTQQFYRLSQ